MSSFDVTVMNINFVCLERCNANLDQLSSQNLQSSLGTIFDSSSGTIFGIVVPPQ
jgi:hypothetical protein